MNISAACCELEGPGCKPVNVPATIVRVRVEVSHG